MVELQACTDSLDAPCAPVLPKPSVLSLSRQRSSRASKLGAIEEGGLFTCDRAGAGGGGGGGAVSARPPLKRARAEDDESSISSLEMSPASGGSAAPPVLHHHHHHHHVHHHPAVETTSNFAAVAPQQVTSDQNGHQAPPSTPPLEPRLGGDPQVMTESNHRPALLYPKMPGPAAYLGVDVAKVLADLERERRINAELLGRVSKLEAKLGSDDKQGNAVQSGNKKSKKQRRGEKATGKGEAQDGRVVLSDQLQPQQQKLPAPIKYEVDNLHVAFPQEDAQQPSERLDTGVTWMSREEVTTADVEKLSKDILASEREDSGDSDDDDDEEDYDDEFEEEEDGRDKKKRKKSERDAELVAGEHARRQAPDGKDSADKLLLLGPAGERDLDEDDSEHEGKKKRRRKKRKEGKKGKRGENSFFTKQSCGQDLIAFRGPGIISSYRKAPKTAFCPKEVKRIMESGVLALKNAQSHTMRKIIVFASLGIRHGCEDLYELDFSHFSIVKRGEPYKSPKDPGEHVLYDHPGVRTKVFYPNRQNSILCPVRILDEERAMRPVGPTCPSCLFLCIKYGGRTRNLPQNEYVRQRMGRNKLKSFGPLMCQMALLVHIRTGSFFFKALGITLLFMAGFPDDLVRKETKYRNLDLLQKYYRSDEDAKGEQLFHPYPPFFAQAMMVAPTATQKVATTTKVVGKKGPPPLLSKPPSAHAVPRYLQPLSARLPTSTSFPMPPPYSTPLPPIPTILPTSAGVSINPPPPGPPPTFGMYPSFPPIPRPPATFPHMPWSSYPQGPYPPPPFAYPPFPQASPFFPPFYGPPYRFPPYGQQPSVQKVRKDDESEESDSSSGGSTGEKKDKGESTDSKEGNE